MADVNVEFGAKDTGLEATLKTVQEQMTKLEAEVKSGTLSFDELSQKMRQLSQASKVSDQIQALGGAAQESAPKIKKLGSDGEQMGKDVQKGGAIGEMSLKQLAGASAVAGAAFAAGMKIFDAALAGARNSIQSFADALAMGGRLDDLSKRTGVAAGELMVLERAFTNAGVGGENLGPTINKLQNAIVTAGEGTGEAAKAFDRLGLSVSSLRAMSPQQQFEAVSKAIAAIPDPAARSAAAIDIFGKSGGQLNQIFGNLNRELSKARNELGSLPGMMNTVAATFGDVEDNIKKIQGKFMEFAAGALQPMLPMIESITTALTRIDAAKIGADLVQAFVGGTKAMEGFKSALKAIEGGDLGMAFNIIFESIKLQIMQTGNAIITNFTAAFKTVGDIMAQIFRADGPSFMVMRSAFDFIAGYAKEKIAGSMSEMFASMGPAFANISEGLKQHADAGATASALALQRIPIAAQLAAEDIAKTLGGATGIFNQNLAKSESKFFDIEAQQAKVKKLQDQITGATEETNEKIASSLSLNGDFNSSLDDSNEHLKLSKELAGQISGSTGEIKTNTEGATEKIKEFKSFVDLIADSKPDEPIKSLSQKSADARKEIEAFGEYIGMDLARMSMPDIAKKLGVDTLGMDGSEQIDAIVKHIQKELPKAKQSVVDEKKSEAAVAATAKKAGEDLKQALDYAVDTGQGGKVLGSIESMVSSIKTFVEAISNKLPQQALA